MTDNRRLLFVVGTAGSGKSSLTGVFSEWLRDHGQYSATVNLDPAAITLPYEPDVDVREFVDYERIMATKNLGPNGGLVASVREAARNIDEIAAAVEETNAEWLLVDTPGQLELFAFRKEGRIITKKISDSKKLLLFLMDSVLCAHPRNYAATLFLSVSTIVSLGLPSINILSRADAVPARVLARIFGWHESEGSFSINPSGSINELQTTLSREIVQAVWEISNSVPLVAVSSKTFEGFNELFATLTRIYGEGEIELQ
ncbi:MAG: ATP/GTP-binding protein [Candidatus Caldarchaeum sp.]|nr:ATP/GTP-binding protein [Candidatus Caldarchaeum sp.]